MRPKNPLYYKINLSDDAILAFREFRHTEHTKKRTSIDSHRETTLTFLVNREEKKYEIVKLLTLTILFLIGLNGL